MNDLLKRKGIVKFNRDLIEDNPEKVVETLKDVLVVAVDNDFITNTLIYKCYSKYFDIIDLTENIPTYLPEVINLNNKIKIKWHRNKEYSENDVKTILEKINNELTAKMSEALKNIQY